jgi:ureidoacrylate peracid hydrolase
MRPKTFAPGPAELGEILAPGRTALLVIDVQNDFGHPEGVMGKAGVNMATVDPAVTTAEKLIEAAHAAGAPVVFMGLQTTAQRDSRPATLRRERLGQPYSEDRRVCRKGTWGAEWYRLNPEPRDIVLSKSRYSSFQDTELDLQLKALGVDTVIACGLTTECCVETAVRDGFHRDYHMFLAQDASASYDLDLHAVSVRTMGLYCALILDSQAIVDAWTPLAAERAHA